MTCPSDDLQPDSVAVTVVLTVCDRTAFLPGALRSVLAQTLSEFEVLVADDSADQESAQAVCELCDQVGDPRVKYVPGPRQGVANNIRNCVEKAKYDLLAIVNDDDEWANSYLAQLVPPLQGDPDLVLAFGDHWVMTSQGIVDDALSESYSQRYARSELEEGRLPCWVDLGVMRQAVPLAMSAVFRKSAIEWNRLVPEVGGAYDFWITCLLAATRRPAWYVDRRLSRYRVHNGMESARQAAGKNREQVAIFDELLRQEWFPEYRTLFRRQRGRALVTTGQSLLRFGQLKDARACFWRVFPDFLCTGYRTVLKASLGLLATLAPAHLTKRIFGTAAKFTTSA